MKAMQRYAEERIKRMRRLDSHRPLRLHIRDCSRPRDNRPANGTYCDRVAAARLDPAVARARFAVFVDRALKDARTRGLTDREISRRSKVATSTFHRWRQNTGRGLPELDRVRAFCDAVGASVEDAMQALGMTDADPEPTPGPPIPDDVRKILRVLADPNASEETKVFLRMSLNLLAGRAADPRAPEQPEQTAS
jgi:transcriptional regulator with XRE-family HTH domain